MACEKKLTEDILFDCADESQKGIAESKAVIINSDDVDWAATVIAGATITDLVLKAGTTGISLTWYRDLASANSAFSPSTDDMDGFLNNFLGRMATTTADHSERCSEMQNGRFIVVYETKYKGIGLLDAFKVRGLKKGMVLSEMTDNTNENGGSILFTLGTEEGDLERYPYRIYLKTDYATSKIAFDALFAPA